MKKIYILVLSVVMMWVFVGCSKTPVVDNIIITGQIQELNLDGQSMTVAVFSGISEDILAVTFNDDFSFPFIPYVGQTIELEISPIIAEIYPPRATSISIKNIE